MTSRIRWQRIGRGSRKLALGALLCGAGAFAGAAPARAGLPSPGEVHREVRAHVHEVLNQVVRVPERIERRHQQHLQVFFGGRRYYSPHRHEHVVYRYPVWIDNEVYYRPYTYCNGRLFERTSHRPQVWREWGNERHGRWCGHHHAYYPNRHACFRPRVVHRPVVVHRHHASCGHAGSYDRHHSYRQRERHDDDRDDRQRYDSRRKWKQKHRNHDDD